MEVRPGYKRTEVGVIPEAWEVVRLNDCMNLLTDFEANGSFEHVAQNVRVYSAENYAWYVRATDLENDTPLSNVRYVDRTSYRFLKKTALAGNEVLLTKRGEIGKVYLFQGKTPFATLAPNLYLLKLGDTVIPSYVFAYFKYGHGQRALKGIDASTTLGALYKNDVKAILLPRPPLTEQVAIAEALVEVDALVAGMDRLIAKKRDLKQASMQQLLTGQTRLPGFSGAWETRAIGADIDLLTGFPFSSGSYSQHGVRLLRGSNVKRGETDWSEDLIQYWPIISPDIAKYELKAGDLVIAMDGSLVGRSYAKLSATDLPALLLQRVARIRSKKIDIGFLSHVVGSDFFIRYCDSVKTVTAIPHISASDIRNFVISIPPSLPEQTAIAAVLSDMDAELSVLEARRDKTGALKQAMMQELLTGRTRLI